MDARILIRKKPRIPNTYELSEIKSDKIGKITTSMKYWLILVGIF